MRALAVAAALCAAMGVGAARAHDGVVHATPEEAAAHVRHVAHAAAAQAPAATAPQAGAPSPFPLAIRAAFDLTDHTGARRRAEDFAGGRMLVFFGYATCESICDVALPRMAQALDLLGAEGAALTPVLITVDPENDTPQALAQAAPRIHPRLLGLTGDETALAAARKAFQVTSGKLFEAPDGVAVYAHGSLIYLVGPDGQVETILPPILGPERMAEILRGYL